MWCLLRLQHLQFYDPWVCREGLSSISFSGEVCFHTPECVWKAPSAGRLQAGGGVRVLTMSYFQPEQNCCCWNTLICVSKRKVLSQCHTQYLMPHYSMMFSHIKTVCPLPDAESWKIVLYMQPLLTSQICCERNAIVHFAGINYLNDFITILKWPILRISSLFCDVNSIPFQHFYSITRGMGEKIQHR